MQKTDSAQVLELVKTYNFATMIVSLDRGLQISHLPFHYVQNDGAFGTLYAHMAIANRQARSLKEGAEVTVIFQGPHSYISPAWYAPKPDNVPTWNYTAVHMRGPAKVISDGVEAFAQMRELVELHDSVFTLDLTEEDRDDMMQAICVFKIEVANIDAKFKLSQNRSEFDQGNVIKHLKKGSPLDQETARYMENTKKSDS